MDKFLIKPTTTTIASTSTSVNIETINLDAEQQQISIDCSIEDDLEPESRNRKRKRATVKYNDAWELEPELKGWLEKPKDAKHFAYCSACSISLKASAGKTDLYKHGKTSGHIKNVVSINLQPKVTTLKFTGIRKETMKSELQICAFIAEHNLAFRLSDHLMKMQKNAYHDSKICQNVSCNRTKTTSIVKNVLGKQQFDDLCKFMRTHKFSMCIDESTDISTSKILSIVVRVCKNFIVQDCIFKLIKVSAADAKTLYSSIVEVFMKQDINYKENLLGFAADGANTMTGINNSVSSLLKIDCPNIVVLKCICHSFALCASYACLKLPSSVETLAREIYNYIGNSPKRTAQFDDILILLEDKPRKLLHPSQTRWLSLEKVVNRLLDFYEPLKIYFAFAVNCDHIQNAQTILDSLNNPFNQLYLKFLQFILPQINKLNRIFQSEKPQIHKVYSDIRSLVSTILDYFIKPDYLKNKDIDSINFKHPHNLINNKDLYLGVEVNLQLQSSNLQNRDIEIFKNNCLAFYIELCEQMFKRFEFKNTVFKDLSLLDPQKTIKKNILSLTELFIKFPNLISRNNLQKIDSEYREIRNLNFSELFFHNIDSLNVEEFWKKICEIERQDKSIAFPLMSNFISCILTLPHSSANVERTFSQINLNKTKIRNRLETDTLEGILLTKDYLRCNNCECHNFKINEELLKKFNSEMYL